MTSWLVFYGMLRSLCGMNLSSSLLIAVCGAGLAAGIASAETMLTIAADTPSVEITLRRGGRNFLRLPTLEEGEYSAISSFRGKKVLFLVYASW